MHLGAHPLAHPQVDGATAPVFDRLLPFAEDRLRATTLELEAPVAVLGDASFSMDVAIRTSVR